MAVANAYFTTSQPLLTENVTVGAAAVVANRFINRAGGYPAAIGGYVAGVTDQNGAIAQRISMTTAGVAVVEVGAEITAADTPLVADTTGKVRPASALAIATGATPVTSSAANGSAIFTGGVLPQHIVGWAIDTATGSGVEFVRVRLA